MKSFVSGLVFVLPALVACSSPSEARDSLAQPVTLLVTNATCTPGPCVTFRLTGWNFLGNGPEPFQMDFGTVHDAVTCLAVPDRSVNVVTGTTLPIGTTYVWRTTDPATFSAVSDSTPHMVNWPGHRVTLIPADSPGWSVTVSDSGADGLARADPCSVS